MASKVKDPVVNAITDTKQIAEYVWAHINDAPDSLDVGEKAQLAAADITYSGLPSGVSTTTTNGVIKTTPSVKDTAQAIIADPNSVTDKAKTILDPNLWDKTTSILGAILDSSDEADWGNPVTAKIENVWDTSLRTVGFMYDSINRLGTAAISALPGGTQTLDWGQTENISFGQEMVANAGIIAGDIKNNRGNALSNAFGMLTNPYTTIGLLTDSNNAIQQPGWNILSPEDRKIFESGWERFGSGSIDTAYTLLADPFIVGGKVLKVTRLKFDRPWTPENATKVWSEIDTAVNEITVLPDVKPVSPFGMFIHEVLQTDSKGEKLLPLREIQSRAEIGTTKVSESIAAALYKTNSAEVAGHILKSAYGNTASHAALARLDFISADALITARKMQYWDEVVKGNLGTSTFKAKKAVQESQDMLDSVKLQRELMQPVSQKVIDAAEARLKLDVETLSAIETGTYPSYYVGQHMNAGRTHYIDAYVAAAEEQNSIFALANSDKIKYAAASDNISFAPDNRIGRAVSRSRARRAKAAYEQKTSQNMKHSYLSEDYFGNSIGTKTLRIWRRLGNLRSNTYVQTTPSNVNFSIDVGANLDEIVAFSNTGIPVKEKIFNDVVSDFAKGDPNEAINLMESKIVDHLSDFYKINKDVLIQVVDEMKKGEANYSSQIQKGKSKFFVSEDGANTLDRIPDIESQLQNGRFLIPWRDIEKRIIQLKKNDPSGEIFTRYKDDRGLLDYVKFSGKAGYLAFNDLWRPMILFRLGYTQRNVTEGLFRASAYLSSVDPLGWAVRGAVNAPSNFMREKGLFVIDKKSSPNNPVYRIKSKSTRIQNKLEKLLEQSRGSQWDANVTKLQSLQGQEKAARTVLSKLRRMETRTTTPKEVEQMINKLLFYNPGEGTKTLGQSVTSLIKKYEADLQRIDAEKTVVNQVIVDTPRRALPGNVGGTKFAAWREKRLDSLLDDINQDIAFESEMTKEVGGISNFTSDDMDILVNLRAIKEAKQTRLTALEMDDAFALQEYMNQAGVGKKKVVKGSNPLYVSGYKMESAFSDPLTASIHWENMSANNTVRRTLSARDQLQSSILSKKIMTDYVSVEPGEQNYWIGMERMLRQYSNSVLIKKILAGETSEEIANYLLLDSKGRELSKLLDEAAEVIYRENPTAGQGIRERIIGDDPKQAYKYAEMVKAKLKTITGGGNEEVLQIMSTRVPTSAELESILGKNPDLLSPIVGFESEFTGFLPGIQIFKNIAARAFEVIGTLPEDALVRGPFYSNRFETSRNKMLAVLLSQQKGERVSVDALKGIEMASHRIALGETKEWLYTIDNRTFLSHYAEWIAPFITATQNSAKVITKLIRRDPALPGIMAALWNAPNKMGWEDKDGNLFIPLPHDLIPDSLEKKLGISGLTGLTVNKNQINVVFPETGFGFVPRPGPLFQVAASELMKNGFIFGLGPEAPSILIGILGQDNADVWWKHFKDYIFGEDQGISDNQLSSDKFLAPWMNKAIQLIQDQGSSEYAYMYGLLGRTEDLKYQAGMRDAPASPEELSDMTNGNYILRMAMNLLAFTPPNFVTYISPTIEVARLFDQQYGMQGPRMMNETFGAEIQLLSKTNTTRNVGGATPDDVAVRNIKKYGPLIEKITQATGEADLSVLGIIVNDNRELTGDPITDINMASPYDVSAYRWMSSTPIPGTHRNWRELLTGSESIAESQRLAGWVEYTKFMDGLDALLKGAGLPNYRVKEAQRYNDMRTQFKENMMNNPLYVGWRSDAVKLSSSKSMNTVVAITTALQDPQFVEDNADSRTWQAAARYIAIRDQVSELIKESGHGIDAAVNQGIADSWATAQQQLKDSDVRWANIANRFLANDDLISVGPNEETIRQGVA